MGKLNFTKEDWYAQKRETAAIKSVEEMVFYLECALESKHRAVCQGMNRRNRPKPRLFPDYHVGNIVVFDFESITDERYEPLSERGKALLRKWLEAKQFKVNYEYADNAWIVELPE